VQVEKDNQKMREDEEKGERARGTTGLSYLDEHGQRKRAATLEKGENYTRLAGIKTREKSLIWSGKKEPSIPQFQ